MRFGQPCPKCRKGERMTRRMVSEWWSQGCTTCRWTTVHRAVRRGIYRVVREMYA